MSKKPRPKLTTPKSPSVDELLSHPKTGHWSLKPGVEELLERDYPELIRDIDRIAGRIRASRQKRRATLAQEFRDLRDQYTEHTLDKLSRMAEDDPGLLWYLQQRGDLARITLALMLSRRRQRRWSPSQDEIAGLVDRVAEGTSVYKARKRVAKMLNKSEAAVKKAHSRSKKRNNEDR
jgi:hypothetical protein